MEKTIEEFDSFDESNTVLLPEEQYVLVLKPNGTLYRMKSSILTLPSDNKIEFLRNSIEIASGKGEKTISTSGLFSKKFLTALMISIEIRPGGDPSTYLYFYTKADRSSESQHTFKLSASDKAQWSGHFFWVPVVNGNIYLKYTMSSGSYIKTKAVAAI